MNLWFRLLKMLLTVLFRLRLNLLDESVLAFRVAPTDLDFNIHMTNARYPAFLDLGRVDLILRNGLAGLAWRRRLQPVVGGMNVRFRRALKPFQPFVLRTRLLGWNEKFWFFEQIFETEGELMCRALVRGAFVDRDGTVPPVKMADLLGHKHPSPPLPHWVVELLAAEASRDRPAMAEVEQAKYASE